VAKPFFPTFVWKWGNSSPAQKKKMVGSGHARLRDVAIKIIDGNLTLFKEHSSKNISIIIVVKIIGGKNVGG